MKECSCCHKPYDDLSFFELHPDRCNSCHKKLQNAKMKKEEEKMNRSVSPPVSESDGEILQSEIEDDDSSRKFNEKKQFNDEEESPEELPSRKKKKVVHVLDLSEEDEGSERGETAMKKKRTSKNRKKQQSPSQTLLKFLDVGEGKKQVTFDVEKKKKRKYSRKQVTTGDEFEDASAFEDLVRSLGKYKRLCPTRTSVQVFLMSK